MTGRKTDSMRFSSDHRAAIITETMKFRMDFGERQKVRFRSSCDRKLCRKLSKSALYKIGTLPYRTLLMYCSVRYSLFLSSVFIPYLDIKSAEIYVWYRTTFTPTLFFKFAHHQMEENQRKRSYQYTEFIVMSSLLKIG